jgi:serine protein kinase
MGVAGAEALLNLIRQKQDLQGYRERHWTGGFSEYVEIVMSNPRVARNSYQRLYDMILSYGVVEYTRHHEKHIHYRIFDDPIDSGRDAVFGLDAPLMRLVNNVKSAAYGYGTEKRILLLHGPVGSSKSTIARLLKKGTEVYSNQKEGALYTYGWRTDPASLNQEAVQWCPMHEDPLHLIPLETQEAVYTEVNRRLGAKDYRIGPTGNLCPFCRKIYQDLMTSYDGNWDRATRHVVVRRLILSEKDRVGIGTFQPKDEKNQDSTELTGDLNYRKIAEYGSDTDPRAFNFDGELNIANRGIIEFIEILKLDVAFLYDLLGASQEHKIKPKKFPQTDIDEVILGHSVSGREPLPYRFRGAIGWATMADLYAQRHTDCAGLEVLAHDFEAGGTRWTPVRSLLRHRFTGELLTTDQKWGVVETTPNHSIYGRGGATFYPEQRGEIMAARTLPAFAPERALVVDALAGVPGFVRSDVRVAVGGGPMTRPCRPGWARLDLPRHATEVQALYDTARDADALKDLITVLVWYATEGHVNGGNGGIVISQADPKELERVRAAYAHISSGRGSIDPGAKSDSAWRLYLGSSAIAALAKHHCGEGSENKRLPDFLFDLPDEFLEHAFDELMRRGGTRRLSRELERTASPAYRARFFEYKTVSRLLAAQVGTLASLLGYDYSVYRQDRPGYKPAYRIRFVSGEGKKGGRHRTLHARLHRRAVFGEWVYDIECEGLHNFVCGVGNVVCHNTNEPEYRKLQNNELMEAFRDRTVKIDIPYNTVWKEEVKIYSRDFNEKQITGKHIAPHTIEMSAIWAVLTRLEEPKKAQITLIQKMKLYGGKTLPGFTEDNIKEFHEESPREGMDGISPRYIQDKISNALVRDDTGTCVNPFMVLNELEAGLSHHSLITREEIRKRYRELLSMVKQEYEDVVKNEVQKAISADEDAIARLCGNYVDNIKAYTFHEKVRNKFTGQEDDPDERLMRSIEEKIDISESRKDDFRREIMNYIAALALEGKQFDYKTNERLQKALELKLFEDQKDSIKLTSLVSSVVDRDTQEKIDIVKGRLIKNYGYCDVCATDVLNYVASIFARGDTKQR